MAWNNAVDATQTGMQFINTLGQWSAPALTANAPVIGTATNGIATTAALTNGQVLIGSTGAAPVPASLTAGTGIVLTPGAGTLSIATTANTFTWLTTSASVAVWAVNTGYFAISPGGALTFLLPASSVLGDMIRLSLRGATSWQITQGAGQQIFLGSSSTTAGAGGSLTSTAQGDSIHLVCSAANLWVAQSVVGNITFV